MRGSDGKSVNIFSYVDPDERIPKKYPLRLICVIVNSVLAVLSANISSAYSSQGLPPIAPEKLFQGFLLRAFY
jgi:hypothetical protein